MSEAQSKKSGLLGRLFKGGEREEPQERPEPAETEPDAAVTLSDAEAEAAGRQERADAEPEITATGAEIAAREPSPDPEREAAEPEAAPAPASEPQKKGWFSRLKDGLTKTSSRLSEGITTVFTRRKLDDETLEELEDLLIQADLGVDTAMRITERLAAEKYDKEISPEEVREVLAAEVEKALAPVAQPLEIDSERKPHVILVVGVNGTGKTTTIGKYARKFTDDGKRVILAAGDTFRAAAVEQLKIWGERVGAPVVTRDIGADAAGLAYDALKQAKDEQSDVLMIDTAGRLQNKADLMAELEKIIRVIRKLDETAPHTVLLTLDATTGQNAMQQVEVFKQTAGVTGIVMTKLDGTARGGILVAIAAKHALPVYAIGVGETIDDLQPFAPDEFARAVAAIS
ncbi:MAG: signal recognition particle-docking protein FtsY [Dichotomicrobium sp.]